MSSPFSRSLRAIESELTRGWRPVAVAAALLFLWAGWFLFARIPFYETSSAARIPDVAMTLNNLALLLAGMGRGDEAEPLYERALRTFASRLEPGHPKVRACVDNYAALLRDRGRGAAARALEKRY